MYSIRPFGLSDVSAGMRLKTQASWNQLSGDWERMLALEPDGSFVAEAGGAVVGTVATCIFGDVGWIAMMLVEASFRGQGLGKALMLRALDYLDEGGVSTVRLDATPLGQPLYEKLGFSVDYPLARYAGMLASDEARILHCAPTVTQYEPWQWADLEVLDRRVTGTRREKLLASLLQERPEAGRVAQRDSELVGFVSGRPGSNAWHVGPCLALDVDAGMALYAEVACRLQGRQVFVDVPNANRPAIEWLLAHGLSTQRPLTRMTRGPRVADSPQEIWASFGPEMG